jgi:hypothetical protein
LVGKTRDGYGLQNHRRRSRVGNFRDPHGSGNRPAGNGGPLIGPGRIAFGSIKRDAHLAGAERSVGSEVPVEHLLQYRLSKLLGSADDAGVGHVAGRIKLYLRHHGAVHPVRDRVGRIIHGLAVH